MHVISPIDRESYPFEEVEEPSVYLRLKIYCPPPAELPDIQPFNLHDVDNIVYDPMSTLVQLVIADINDNPPVFPEKHILVGYPVSEVIDTIVPKHLVQVKVSVSRDIHNVTFRRCNYYFYIYYSNVTYYALYCENRKSHNNNNNEIANPRNLLIEKLINGSSSDYIIGSQYSRFRFPNVSLDTL